MPKFVDWNQRLNRRGRVTSTPSANAITFHEKAGRSQVDSSGFWFDNGREAIVAFFHRKWSRELDYQLIKELWAYSGNRIAVRFAYEWHDDSGNWFRSYGNENWEFDGSGLMRLRLACINDLPIKESDRKYHWALGNRPVNHPRLSELGL